MSDGVAKFDVLSVECSLLIGLIASDLQARSQAPCRPHSGGETMG